MVGPHLAVCAVFGHCVVGLRALQRGDHTHQLQLIVRSLLIAMPKHVLGLVARADLMAHATPTAGFCDARQQVEQLVHDPDRIVSCLCTYVVSHPIRLLGRTRASARSGVNRTWQSIYRYTELVTVETI
jgi:hypothetical protein